MPSPSVLPCGVNWVPVGVPAAVNSATMFALSFEIQSLPVQGSIVSADRSAIVGAHDHDWTTAPDRVHSYTVSLSSPIQTLPVETSTWQPTTSVFGAGNVLLTAPVVRSRNDTVSLVESTTTTSSVTAS